jgi:hypothetical protein
MLSFMLGVCCSLFLPPVSLYSTLFLLSPLFVQLLGPPRVWLKNAPLPGLNMSRSLGDLIAKQAGVISTPHKAIHAISTSDRCLVLASDGLWDFVGNEETASVALSTADTWEAAARLARLARARWLTRTYGADDTTVVIVRFGPSAGGGGVAAAGGAAHGHGGVGGGGGAN